MSANRFQLPRASRRKLQRAARNVIKRMERKEARKRKEAERNPDLVQELFDAPVRPEAQRQRRVQGDKE